MTTRRSLFAAAAAVVPLVTGVAVVEAATPKRHAKVIAYLQERRTETLKWAQPKYAHPDHRDAWLAHIRREVAALDDMLAELEA